MKPAASSKRILLVLLMFLATRLSWSSQMQEVASVQEMASSHGLSISEFDEFIKSSETSADFAGLPSSGATSQLWIDATVFQYQLAVHTTNATNATNMKYWPYILCSTAGNLSGQQRRVQLQDRLAEIYFAEPYYLADTYRNDDAASCFLASLPAGPAVLLLPDLTAAVGWLRLHPALPSMKISNGTVAALAQLASQQAAEQVGEQAGEQVGEQVGFSAVLCPGVAAPADQLLADLQSYLFSNNQSTVAQSSFYYHRIHDQADGQHAVHTDRMLFWTKAISNSLSSNSSCLDRILDPAMQFLLDTSTATLHVRSKLTTHELFQLGQLYDMTTRDVQDCLYYLLMALALNPLLCSIELQPTFKLACSDGTVDISKCPEDTTIRNHIDNDNHDDNDGNHADNTSHCIYAVLLSWIISFQSLLFT